MNEKEILLKTGKALIDLGQRMTELLGDYRDLQEESAGFVSIKGVRSESVHKDCPVCREQVKQVKRISVHASHENHFDLKCLTNNYLHIGNNLIQLK